MRPTSLQATALLVPLALLLSGCAGNASNPFDPNAAVALTGKTVHLNMQVVDLTNTTLYPGLNANLWAFCASPVDPSDTYSAAAVEQWTPLAGDGPALPESLKGSCSVPGPTIRVHQGDRVIVEFSHSHFHPHTIHWHGQYVPDGMDGVPGVTQEAVPTGGSFTYDFIAKRPGTLWYHCHVDTQFHVMQGLYGMFIVIPKDQSHEPKDIAHEYNIVLSTAHRSTVEAIPGVPVHAHPAGCFVSGTANCQNPTQDTSADVYLMNGHSFPLTEEQEQTLVKIKQGERIRVRLLNAGNTVEEFHLHGHDMLVTHKDGLPLVAPYYADTVNIGPAERYDVVIDGNNPGVWVFHTHVNDHEANDGQGPGGMHGMMVYDGYMDKMHDFPSELPGGLAYQKPKPIPDDLRLSTELHLGSGTALPAPAPAQPAAVSASWRFPITMECSVLSADLQAYLSGSAAAFAGSDLTLTLSDPQGTELQTMHLGRTGSGTSDASSTWNATQKQTSSTTFALPTGNYTLSLTGTSMDATVHLAAHVDYYASYDEMKISHHLHKTPLCGRYGNGNDVGESQPPGSI